MSATTSPRAFRLLRRRLLDTRAAVAIEAAFALIFMVVLLAAVLDFGGYIRVRTELKQALRAGGQFALDLGALGQADYNDQSAIETAITPVIEDAASLTTVTVDVVASYCLCGNGDTVGCPGTVSFAQCTDTDKPGGRFIEVEASATYNPFFPFTPWFSENMEVKEKLVFRVQ